MNDDFDFMLTRLEELSHDQTWTVSQINEVSLIRSSLTPIIQRLRKTGLLDDLLIGGVVRPTNVQLKVTTRQTAEVIDF